MSHPIRILGVDPDTKNTGFAIVQFPHDKGKPVVTRVFSAAVRQTDPVATRIVNMVDAMAEHFYDLDMPDFTVVEGQMKYPNDRVRPNDLINLAQVTGAAVGLLQHNGMEAFTIVKPHTWKGTVKKDAFQRRILSKVIILGGSGINYLTKIQHGHVIDAIGLALWGYENLPS